MAARFLVAMLMAVALIAPAHAQKSGAQEHDLLDKTNVPATVAAQIPCGTEADFVTRRPFAGGFVFAWQCAGNNANFIQALVFAPSADGAGARLMRFPTPRKGERKWSEELSNVRWFPRRNELTELFVDPESTQACRTEARWRLMAPEVRPVLVFWRETRDCNGKRGWRVLAGPR